jgi:hypothetical protein
MQDKGKHGLKCTSSSWKVFLSKNKGGGKMSVERMSVLRNEYAALGALELQELRDEAKRRTLVLGSVFVHGPVSKRRRITQDWFQFWKWLFEC